MRRFLVLLTRLPARLLGAAAPILRLLAALALLAAVISFTSDFVLQRPSTTMATYWQALSPASYAASAKAVTAFAGEWLWTRVLSAPLSLPAYVLFASLGIILGIAGRRRRRVEIYVN
ncbi:MAG: hypothetical protein JNM89_05640 [Hyphomicrobiaceae bacterium]|nr:hypothetical protein [Hyphomicrobiaceae bacterium]